MNVILRNIEGGGHTPPPPSLEPSLLICNNGATCKFLYGLFVRTCKLNREWPYKREFFIFMKGNTTYEIFFKLWYAF